MTLIEGEPAAHTFQKRPVVLWEGLVETFTGQQVLARLTVVIDDRYVSRFVAWLLSLGRNIRLKEALRLEADILQVTRQRAPAQEPPRD